MISNDKLKEIMRHYQYCGTEHDTAIYEMACELKEIREAKGNIMDVREYFETKKRLLNSKCDNVECRSCPFNEFNNLIGCSCGSAEFDDIDRAIEIVKDWAAEHPRKTYLQDFLEKYPNVELEDDGTPKAICPYMLGYCDGDEGLCSDGDMFDKGDLCVKCWNREMEA